MGEGDRCQVVRLADAQARIPGPAGERAVMVLQRGPLDVAFSARERPIQQTPHAQDEIYFIIRGRGMFAHDGRRDSCEQGDLVFVPAGAEHQFEETSGDFAVWRVFYGPPGGEVPE